MEVRFGKLDYPAKELAMKAETPEEVMRLGSVQKEPQTVKWLERAVKTDDIIYDVGACIGAYSLIAATLISEKGRVYAFEPAWPSLAALFINTSVNKLVDRLIPMPMAFGPVEEIAFLPLSSLHAGAASHGMTRQQFPQPALTMPMDLFIERYGIPPPCLMKIDVDRNEMRVLKGALKTLRNPVLREVLVEVDDRQGKDRLFIERVMHEAGFRLKEKHTLISSLEQDVWNRLYVRREP